MDGERKGVERREERMYERGLFFDGKTIFRRTFCKGF